MSYECGSEKIVEAIALIIDGNGSPMSVRELHTIYQRVVVAPEDVEFVRLSINKQCAYKNKTSKKWNLFYLAHDGLIGLISWPMRLRIIEEGWEFCEDCAGRGCVECAYRGVMCWIDHIVGIKKLKEY